MSSQTTPRAAAPRAEGDGNAIGVPAGVILMALPGWLDTLARVALAWWGRGL